LECIPEKYQVIKKKFIRKKFADKICGFKFDVFYPQKVCGQILADLSSKFMLSAKNLRTKLADLCSRKRHETGKKL